MSANDGVYVVRCGNKFSVAVVSAIDNLYFYRSIGGDTYKKYVEAIWGNAKSFPALEAAMEYGKALAVEAETEYGAQYLDLSECVI
jgi:hypothetical protein